MSTAAEFPEDPEPQQTSEAFNAPDADIVFKSSDNVLFRIHRKNLEVHAAAFPPPAFNTNGEIVSLSEDALTLEDLFPYIYPLRHPRIDLLSFDSLSKVAEAAEKYEMFSVMHICKLRMVQLIPEYPAEVLNYAFMHDYPNVMQLTVPCLLDRPLAEVVPILIPKLIAPWIRCREALIRAARQAIVEQYCSHCGTLVNPEACKVWIEMEDNFSRKAVSDALKSFEDTDIIDFKCPNCHRSCDTYEGILVEGVLRHVPPFSSYL